MSCKVQREGPRKDRRVTMGKRVIRKVNGRIPILNSQAKIVGSWGTFGKLEDSLAKEAQVDMIVQNISMDW